jgi:hypothetical protein
LCHAPQARQVATPFKESPRVNPTGVRVDDQLQDLTFFSREAAGFGLFRETTLHRDEIDKSVGTSLLVYYFPFSSFPRCLRFGRWENRFFFIKYLVGDYQSASSLANVFRMPDPVGPRRTKRHV